ERLAEVPALVPGVSAAEAGRVGDRLRASGPRSALRRGAEGARGVCSAAARGRPHSAAPPGSSRCRWASARLLYLVSGAPGALTGWGTSVGAHTQKKVRARSTTPKSRMAAPARPRSWEPAAIAPATRTTPAW